MRNLSDLIIDTTIHGSRHLPKTHFLLSSAMALLLPRKRLTQPIEQKAETTHPKGHHRCDDYYCELC